LSWTAARLGVPPIGGPLSRPRRASPGGKEYGTPMRLIARVSRVIGGLALLSLLLLPAPAGLAQTAAQPFPETGHTVSDPFLSYWRANGGLAQFGYPISAVQTEISALDGKLYTVQYFERAVFELHPENAGTPYNVLLTPLGTLRYQARHADTPASPTPPPATAPPTAPPTTGADCAGIPAAQGQVVTPACGPQGATFHFTGQGFTPGETVVVWITWPDNTVHTASFQRTADSGGQVPDVVYNTQVDSPVGLWATTMAGLSSHTQAVGYFRVTRVLPSAPPPNAACDASGSLDGQATPSSARLGDTIQITGQGFHHGEDNRVWFTSPAGVVIPAQGMPNESIHLDGTLGPFPLQTGGGAFGQATGRWAMTIQGLVSGHRSVIYFCLAR
jgi:hypothetical protein